jgi:hypothetical protein
MKAKSSLVCFVGTVLALGLLCSAQAQVVEEWVARYNGPVISYDEARSLAVDRDGNIYVTGRSFGGSGNDFDYITIKYRQSQAVEH